MNNFDSQMLLLLSPVILIQLGLAVFCIVKILKEGVANLNRWVWAAIVIFGNLIGPIIFLMVGRRRDID
jgi:hypothetical protein